MQVIYFQVYVKYYRLIKNIRYFIILGNFIFLDKYEIYKLYKMQIFYLKLKILSVIIMKIVN